MCIINRSVNFIGKDLLIAISLMASSAAFANGEITFSGNSLHAIDVKPATNTGLDHIYVLYSVEGVSASYSLASGSSVSNVKWYRYSNLGGAFAEEISNVRIDGNSSIIDLESGDMGYIIEDGDHRFYFWIVDYKPYRFKVDSIAISPESDCDYTRLDFEGNAAPIYYYTINGQQRILSREIRVEYENQQWNQQALQFDFYTENRLVDYINGTINIAPPVVCSTSFSVTGDRFLEDWNWSEHSESSVYDPVAVEVRTEAIQENSDSEEEGDSNEIKGQDTGLGGSAPASIRFNAYVSQGVIHHEWQLSRDSEFENPEYRFNEQNLDYTFTEEGTYYLRYIGSNNDGSCEAIGETYTVSIGASELRCPNAFSPNGDGVNDEWKVSYRSIIEFDCWIFDRNGHQIIHLDSPSKGWDGKRGGKLVGPGVYYYVIKARGADGKEYKKSGDINIIRHIQRGVSGSSGN